MDRLHAMRTFRAVVEQGGFSAAARSLGLSAASVSRQVTALEGHLSVALLHRTTRAVSTTAAGQSYYTRCVMLLDELDDLESSLRDTRREPRGTIRMSAPMSFGLSGLASRLGVFCSRHAQLSLDLRLADRKVDLVGEGYDLALRVSSSLPDSSLIAVKLGATRNVVCASPTWVERHGLPTAPDELAAHRCLVYAGHDHPDRWTLHADGASVTVKVGVGMICDNSLALQQAALAGLGPTSLPYFAASDDLTAGRLVVLCPDWTGRASVASLLYPPDRYLSARVRLLIDFLKEEARGGRLGLDVA